MSMGVIAVQQYWQEPQERHNDRYLRARQRGSRIKRKESVRRLLQKQKILFAIERYPLLCSNCVVMIHMHPFTSSASTSQPAYTLVVSNVKSQHGDSKMPASSQNLPSAVHQNPAAAQTPNANSKDHDPSSLSVMRCHRLKSSVTNKQQRNEEQRLSLHSVTHRR